VQGRPWLRSMAEVNDFGGASGCRDISFPPNADPLVFLARHLNFPDTMIS